MRSVIAVAALAAGALAVPFVENRGLEAYVQEDVVYETHVVTVTAFGPGAPAPAATTQAAVPAPHYGHKNPSYQAPAPAQTSQAAPAPVYQAPPPVYKAPPPTYSAPSSSGGSSDSIEKPTDYKSKVLYFHNKIRSNHSAPALEWDDGLYSCAKEIASSCVYAHNVEAQGGGYGQNIAAGVDEDNIGSVLADMFYNAEAPLYNYWGQEPDMTNFEQWGHCSQMVWKDTTHVACATQYCPNGLANTGSGVSPYFTVCNYKGPGNYAGQYSVNVLAPLGHPSISNDNPGY